jgi:N-acetylmuramoyl-L-alanine amidase
MRPAAFRFAAVAALAFGFDWSRVVGAEDAPRVAPSRPNEVEKVSAAVTKLAVTRINNAEYVELDDAVARLGLAPKAATAGRKLTFADRDTQLVLESDSREAYVDGLRILLGQPVVTRKRQLYLSKIDFERCLAPLIRPAIVSPLPPELRVIAIDPGHGGTDIGTANEKLGLKEKVFALDVAFRLKKLLEAAGYKTVMTRSDDRNLVLQQRAEIANRAGADLFISIHFNSLYPDTKTSGTEVFVYTPEDHRSTESWGVGQPDDTRRSPEGVNRYDPWSSLFAHKLHRSVIAELKTFDRGQKTKHLLALQDLNCPAALVEAVFLSNDTEGTNAATGAYRQRIAKAIAEGVADYKTTIDGLRPKPKPTGATAMPRPASTQP